jgi:hypothetical protein
LSYVFISYATPDRPRAEELCAQLKRLGIPYWIAPESIPMGELYGIAIDRAIQFCSIVLVLLSNSSDQSEHVMIELDLAMRGKKRIVTVRLQPMEPVKLLYYLSARHWNEWPLADHQLQSIAAENPAAPKVNPKDGLTYVWIPPSKTVNGFWLSQTLVTQAAYERVMGNNPSYFKGDQLPVESVTWFEADAYCKAVGGRLPSEAEWEHAARGGMTGGLFFGAADKIAWHIGNSGGETHPVAEKDPNSYGLYDMLGNVWEWTANWYDDEDREKVLMGGSWNLDPRAVTNNGSGLEPGSWSYVVGFRCVVE